MTRHVQKCSEYSATCAEYQICGLFPKTVEELHQIPIQFQWHHDWLDLVKMPQSILGNNYMYILTLVDLFFLQNGHQIPKNSWYVALVLYEIFHGMGLPSIISIDQGRECVNSFANG